MKENSLLIQEYIQIAIERGNALAVGDHRTANKGYRKLTKIYKELEKDRTIAETVLEELLNYDNYLVQICAAAHALGLNMFVEQAKQTLLEISRMQNIGIIRFEAETTLEEWEKKGNLRF